MTQCLRLYLICIISSVKQKRTHVQITATCSFISGHMQSQWILLPFCIICSLSVSMVSLSLSFQICNINSTAAPQFMFTVTVCTHTFSDSHGRVFMCIWRWVCFLYLLFIVCVIYKHMFLLFKHLSVGENMSCVFAHTDCPDVLPVLKVMSCQGSLIPDVGISIVW